MEKRRILIVDDEKNIRFTLIQALESEVLEADAAINGEDALEKIERGSYDLILLDLKMPGMDGMDVLRLLAKNRPDLRTVIITAHGAVGSAVEAMKLGAVDFLEKPFTPSEIRSVVAKALDREGLSEEQAMEYLSLVELAKKYVSQRQPAAAMRVARKAASLDPRRPEALNLMGVVQEIEGEAGEARKSYRAAYSLDPSYAPSRKNLEREDGSSHGPYLD